MPYPIILYPDARLTRAAAPVGVITNPVIELLDNLYATMKAHKGGGLAAPQVGHSLQVAVVEVEAGDLIELLNPRIIRYSDTKDIFVEGCLSVPGVYGTVERADEIVVRYYDRSGAELEMTAYDTLARTLQHEIDHLNGELFVDKIIERIPVDELEDYIKRHEDD